MRGDKLFQAKFMKGGGDDGEGGGGGGGRVRGLFFNNFNTVNLKIP